MPAYELPPGELMYMRIGLSGSSASRKTSCATIRFADWSSTSVPRKMIRSRRRREKMSNERSKRPSDSTTIGTSWLNALLIGCAFYTQPPSCVSSDLSDKEKIVQIEREIVFPA